MSPHRFGSGTTLVSSGGVSGAAGWLERGQAFVDRWQRWKGLVRLGLVPVADGVEVVRAGVGVAVLDGGLEEFGEWDGRVEMEAVDAGAAAGKLRANDGRAV